ncbi:hypothetical protein ACO0RG_000651 [Hanseniaspora osmophila]
MNGYFAEADKFLASLQESLNNGSDLGLSSPSTMNMNNMADGNIGNMNRKNNKSGLGRASTYHSTKLDQRSHSNLNANNIAALSNVHGLNNSGNTGASNAVYNPHIHPGHVSKHYNSAGLDRRSNTYDNAFGRLHNKAMFNSTDLDFDSNENDINNNINPAQDLGSRSNTISFQFNNQMSSMNNTLEPLANSSFPVGSITNISGQPNTTPMSKNNSINATIKGNKNSDGTAMVKQESYLFNDLLNAPQKVDIQNNQNQLQNQTQSQGQYKGLGQNGVPNPVISALSTNDFDLRQGSLLDEDFDDDIGSFDENELLDDVNNLASSSLSASTLPGAAGLANQPKRKKKEKVSHNIIEKKYRNNINEKILTFRNIVPTLRVSHKRERGDLILENDYFLLEGLEPAKKLNKATILAKTIEYIEHLETKCEILTDQNMQLKNIINSSTTNASTPRNTNFNSYQNAGQQNHLKNLSAKSMSQNNSISSTHSRTNINNSNTPNHFNTGNTYNMDPSQMMGNSGMNMKTSFSNMSNPNAQGPPQNHNNMYSSQTTPASASSYSSGNSNVLGSGGSNNGSTVVSATYQRNQAISPVANMSNVSNTSNMVSPNSINSPAAAAAAAAAATTTTATHTGRQLNDV